MALDALTEPTDIVRPGPQTGLQTGPTFDVVRTRAGFDALEADWNDLFARTGRGEQMFQGFNWLWHWANHYLRSSDELAIVTGRQDGRLMLVLPLTVERVAGLRQLSFMGAPVSQYGDVLTALAGDAGRCARTLS
jgi:CelD/BcsL family acetyltransferase involved in cellulose biosynthesis